MTVYSFSRHHPQDLSDETGTVVLVFGDSTEEAKEKLRQHLGLSAESPELAWWFIDEAINVPSISAINITSHYNGSLDYVWVEIS